MYILGKKGVYIWADWKLSIGMHNIKMITQMSPDEILSTRIFVLRLALLYACSFSVLCPVKSMQALHKTQ